MKILEGLSGLQAVSRGSVLSVGNFDGIHLGHRRLLETAAELRSKKLADSVAIVTFEPHPLTVLRPAPAPPRLTPFRMKAVLLEEAGVDYVIQLAPTPDVLNMEAEDFWELIRDRVQPRQIIEGGSFTFGRNRRGTLEKLVQWASSSAVHVQVLPQVSIPLLNLQVVEVSSSLVRWLLAYGRVRDAALCLGRPYVLQGTVVKGHQRGRTIGVPTANMQCDDQLVPADGVYAGRVVLDGARYMAGLSIGTMPTFGTHQRQIEAHLIGFNGDIYGRTLQVELLDWVRDQRRFGDLAALKSQLARDMEDVAARDRIITSISLRPRMTPLHSLDDVPTSNE